MRPFTRALVTGASGGIGAAIARRLAGRGVHLVLVARSSDALDDLAAQLGDHAVDAEVLVADLLETADRERVETRLLSDDDPVDLLVNNAGIGVSGRVVDQDPDRLASVLDLNATVLTRLTREVLPRYVDAGHGGVLNVSSMGGFQPVPGLAVYAATKAYVTNFTEAVHEEIRGSGVRITALCPGFTRTGFIDAADAEEEASRIPAVMWQDPDEVARAGVDGVERGRAVVIAGKRNRLARGLSAGTPTSLSRRVIGLATGARLRER